MNNDQIAATLVGVQEDLVNAELAVRSLVASLAEAVQPEPEKTDSADPEEYAVLRTNTAESLWARSERYRQAAVATSDSEEYDRLVAKAEATARLAKQIEALRFEGEDR